MVFLININNNYKNSFQFFYLIFSKRNGNEFVNSLTNEPLKNMLFKRDKNNIDEDSDYSLDNKNDKNIDESNEDEDWSDN